MRVRIGIDLGGTKIEGMALNGDGREVHRLRIDTPAGNYKATVDAVCALVQELEEEVGTEGRVGVAMPGSISPATGLIKNANSTWLIGHPFHRDLEECLGREVKIANDADCFAVSEARDGAAAGKRLVFGVILGTGVGGGIAHRGEAIVGANAIAGEWGHNPLPWPTDEERPGRECYCGRQGCLETWLSGLGLEVDHEQATGECVEPIEIERRAEAGDEACRATLERYAERLARGLATVINLLDPDAIVLGGGLSNIRSLYDDVPRHWQEWAFSDRVDTPLLPPAHGPSSGVRGAAWLWGRQHPA
ncbi:MAG TPA: ROK family protein [Thermoanaerobaculia bacterium]|nr:ROK family protein [Thermoanaerobaculia bacterium]